MQESIEITWKSYLIREEGVTTFDHYIASHFQRANHHEEGIIFNPWTGGPYPTWGMPALKASKAAALQGNEKWRRFHLAIMKAFYTEGRNISCEQVLWEIAKDTGLAVEELKQKMEDPKWAHLVYEETREAQQVYGIHAIPAVVVEDRYLVEGAVPLARYQQVIEEVKSFSRFSD